MTDLNQYIKEIETRSKKPLDVQLNDIKLAGAKLLQSIDKLIAGSDKIVDKLDDIK